MNKTMLMIGIISLVIALILYLVGWNVYEGAIGRVNVNVYATWFFFLSGGLLIVRFFLRRRPA